MSPSLFQGSYIPIFKAIFSTYTLTTFADPCSFACTHISWARVTQGSGDVHPTAPKPPHPSLAVIIVCVFPCLGGAIALFRDERKQDRPSNGLVGHDIFKPRSHHKSESYFLVTAQTRQALHKSHTIMNTHTELYIRYMYIHSTNQNNTKEYGCQRRDKISILEKWQNLIREWKKRSILNSNEHISKILDILGLEPYIPQHTTITSDWRMRKISQKVHWRYPKKNKGCMW